MPQLRRGPSVAPHELPSGSKGTQLLRDSHASVASIGAQVGYASEAAFNRAFRRVVGLPPAAWRRQAALG